MLLTACASPSRVAGRSPSCSPSPTRDLQTVNVTAADGAARSYELYVPESVRAPAPLVLSFHGLGGTGRGHASATGWMEFARERGLAVAFPTAVDRWKIEDVAFVRRVVADIGPRACVDASRVFASGHSYGAYFAQRLACDAPDVFASVSAYAGGNPEPAGKPCLPSRPVAVALFHGDADDVVGVHQGRASRDAWVRRLGCSTVPDVEAVGDGAAETHSGCDGSVEVVWRQYAGQDHSWPLGPRRTDMLSRMWAFYERFPRP